MNNQRSQQHHWKNLLLISFGLALNLLLDACKPIPAYSAEQIRMVYDAFDLSVSVKSLESYAETGKAENNLRLITRFLPPQNQEQIRNFLQRRFQSNQVITYKISRTSLVEDLIQELGQVIKISPQRNGFYALRGAIVTASANSEGWTILDVLRNFPTNEVYIDLDALLELRSQWELFSSFREAAVNAIIQESQREASVQTSTDFAQLSDLQKTGPYSYTQEILTVEKDAIRQTRQGLVDHYSFNVNLYLPQNVQSAPLIVISHGFGSQATSFIKLAQHLASYGFAVAIPEHVGSDLAYRQELLEGHLSSALSPIEYIDRPKDITYLLDQLEDPAWKERINVQNVGIIGDSLGATTVLSLAGAKINANRLISACQSERVILNPSVLLQCQARYLPPTDNGLRDPRVKAVISAHPLTSAIFGSEGISKIDIPLLMISGSNDVITPVAVEQIQPFTWLEQPNKYLLLFDPGTHFTSSEPPSYQPSYIASRLIGTNRKQGSIVFRGISVAFMEVYLRGNTAYLPYLSSAYTQKISEPSLSVYFIDSFNQTDFKKVIPQSFLPSPIKKTDESAENIIEEIKQTGVLKVALSRNDAPFGYLDQNGQWTGYCSDLIGSFKEYLNQKLNLDVPIDIIQLPSNNENRFELVKNKVVHLECGPNTIVNHISGVSFSSFFFLSGTHFLVSQSKISQIDPNLSLSGVRIGLLKNTTTQALIQEKYPNSNPVYFNGTNGINEALQALEEDRIDVLADDGILLLTESRQKNLSLENYKLIPNQPLACNYYGLVLPKDDSQWRDLVNAFLSSQSAKTIANKVLVGNQSANVLAELDYCLNFKQGIP